MRKKRKAVLCVMLSLTLLSGCGSSSSKPDNAAETVSAVVDDTAQTPSTDTSETSSDTQIFGQITAIDGNTITIAEADMPQIGQKGDGQAPPSDMPQDGGEQPAPTDMPEGGKGTPPSDMPEGGKGTPPSDMPQGDDQGMQLNMTGETTVITVSDETAITVNGQNGSISDLKTDDIVTVELSGDLVVSIQSGMGGGPGF